MVPSTPAAPTTALAVIPHGLPFSEEEWAALSPTEQQEAIAFFREETAVVNVKDLNRFEAGFVVDAEALRGEGLVKGACPGGIKLLGDGEVTRKLTVKVDRASKTAVAKVEAAGGTVEV